MKQYLFALCAVLVPILSGCSRDNPKSSYGFTLPEGEPTMGEQVFVSYMCHECHTVTGTTFPDLEIAAEKRVKLGGEVSRIQTYGELVTSIINPSHKLAAGYEVKDVADGENSKMTNYNDVMSVSDLIHLVAFLQSKYELKPYEPSPYDMYYYGS